MAQREPLPIVSAQRLRINDRAVARYERELWQEGSRGLTMLRARGLSDETIRGFRLGVVRDPAAGHGHRGWLAIPYLLTPQGMPLTVRFRCLEHATGQECRDSGHGKYATIAGDAPRLFNVGAITSSAGGREIHITEGELDAMLLTQLGYDAIALPGADSWTYHYGRCLAGFSRIYVWGDDDDAGHKMVTTITKAMRQAVGVPIRGGDITEVYLAQGRSEIERLINKSLGGDDEEEEEEFDAIEGDGAVSGSPAGAGSTLTFGSLAGSAE